MSIKFTKLSSILLITTISSLFAFSAKAEKPPSLSEAFEAAYFENAGNSYRKSSIIGQLNTILGFRGFPDKQISADGKLVDKLYEDALKQQSQVGSPIKTRDLNNPYNTSLQENPNYISN